MKYFLIAGIIVAAIIYFALSKFGGKWGSDDKRTYHIWSAGTDSSFMKSCMSKYSAQTRDDPSKKEVIRNFCKCMLEKTKSEYDEEDMNKVKDEEIRKWDKECRQEIFNPIFK